MGTPIWSRGGTIAVANAFKGRVNVTFAYGAFLADPEKLFNAAFEGNERRAINVFEGDEINGRALQDLVRAAIEYNIQASRVAQPNAKHFSVQRIVGAGDRWVTEFILAYDGRPSYAVSIMEFLDGKVARETQYFADPFEPGPSRAQWVDRPAVRLRD